MTLFRTFLHVLAGVVFFGCQDESVDARADADGSHGASLDAAIFPRADLPGTDKHGPHDDAAARSVDAQVHDRGVVGADAIDASGASDVGPESSTQPDAKAPTTMNASFIGSACETDADCAYENGVCLTEQDGFTAGMCSMACEKYCPDADGMVTTFCVDPADLDAGPVGFAGACTMQCRFGPSPTGCRDGYRCEAMTRYSEPETQKFACVPGSPDDEGAFEITACHEALLEQGIPFSPGFNPMASPANHPELVCDVSDPVYVPGQMHGVDFRYNTLDAPTKDIFAACPLGLSLSKSARMLADQGVNTVLHLGVYNCRVINGTEPAILSEHGLANAIDVRGLVNEEGVITVFDHWEKDAIMPATDEGALLKWFVETVFEQQLFTIILTPDYNAAHADHFHMDLTEGAHYLK